MSIGVSVSIEDAVNVSVDTGVLVIEPEPCPPDSADWIRPEEWLERVDLQAEEIRILQGVSEELTFLQLSITGQCRVDFGDGTTTDFTDSVNYIYHEYDFASITSTLTDEGLKQVWISVTPINGDNITNTGFEYDASSGAPRNYQGRLSYILEIVANVPNVELWNTNSNNRPHFGKLQAVELATTSALTNLNHAFSGQSNLRRLHISDTTGVTACINWASGCNLLTDIGNGFDLREVRSAQTIFKNCRSLNITRENLQLDFSVMGTASCAFMFNYANMENFFDVDTPVTIGGTDLRNFMHYANYKGDLPFLNLPNLTNGAGMFSYSTITSCRGISTPNLSSASALFQRCRNLTHLYEWDVTTTALGSNDFLDCQSLVYCNLIGLHSSLNMQTTMISRASALEIFNNMLTVTGGQSINLAGTPAGDSLTAQEIQIATDKGWTVIV